MSPTSDMLKQALANVTERFYGQSSERGRLCEPSVFVTVDHMLNEPEKYGFDGNAIRFTEDLTNAIMASSRDWEYMGTERLPEDWAHAFIFAQARKAVLDILASDFGQQAIADELERLEDDEREYRNDAAVDAEIDRRMGK